jgi:type I restriction enzyme S subunit
MTFRTEIAGRHFELRKGLSYKGTNLVDESEVGLLTIDAFITGGGYKRGAEKPFDGDYKPEYIAEPGDVLLAMTEQQEGLLASPLKVPEDLGGMTELIYSLDVAKVISKSGEISPEFLFNFLRVPLNRRRASYGDTGTTVQRLPYDVIYEQLIPVPSLEEQYKINSFIATLDRKIELNTALASTLEKIAQSVYRSWFVDFDPVKAKMSGEKPVGIDDAIAALFPSSMEDSEAGPIPKGWAKTTIGDVLVKQKPGKLFDQKTTRSKGKIPVLDQGRSGVVGYHDDEPGYVASPENPVVVFANHTCSLRFISYPFSVIQNVFPILGSNISTYWLYFALQGKQNFDSYKGHWPDLVIKSIVRPSSEIADAFGHVVGPLMKQVWNFERQNRLLAEMRDGLLPRLISGELRIPQEMLES